MKQKAFVLQNKGMNRDTSISKVGESSAYENHNIRILARDHDTLLSVTNERGNKEIELNGVIEGELIGWNVLNNYIILFTHDESAKLDRIYRIEYRVGENVDFVKTLLFCDDLGFDSGHPIESVVYHETDEIQKIYWVDGINVLRFMNFMADYEERSHWDKTYFDSNRQVDFGVEVEISKDNSGNSRPNGVVQYLITYYNKHGQESGYVWISDLVYLSPVASGGAADGTNNNSITLNINNLDERFSYFRIYSVFRSALNGTTVAYIVFDGKTNGKKAVVVDNNSHLTSVDATSLLYLGSQHVVAGTLTHKDQTLFLGDLSSVDRDYNYVEQTLKQYMVGENGLTKDGLITFEYDDEHPIPNETSDRNYAYNSQLVQSSSEITSFKGGEKYRFALVFHKKDGTMTDAFWIGDAVNYKYPKMTDSSVTRIIAQCKLPAEVVDMMKLKGYSTAQLMIAEATYADRSVKAQGIVCPTVFNVWNRYMNRTYAAPSWMMRPRNAEYAWKHFEPIHNSIYSTGEIDCNYWETLVDPNPYYQFENYNSFSKDYKEDFDGQGGYDYALLIYRVYYKNATISNIYHTSAIILYVKSTSSSFNASTYTFGPGVLNSINEFIGANKDGSNTVVEAFAEVRIQYISEYISPVFGNSNRNKIDTCTGINRWILEKNVYFTGNDLVTTSRYMEWCNNIAHKDEIRYFNNNIGINPSSPTNPPYTSVADAINDTSGNHGLARWYSMSEEAPFGNTDDYIPSYYKKHLMFIDENVVTLNSPEIEYEAISFDKVDNHNFRIVGVAKIDNNYSDYTVIATPGKLPGENLVKEKLSNTLIAWPLWKECSLDARTKEEGSEDKDYENFDDDPKYRDSYDYIWGGGTYRYWLRMWNHSDKISGYTDYDNDDYSNLTRKVFANSRYSRKTVYNNFRSSGEYEDWHCDDVNIRLFNYTSSQYVGINIGDDSRYYDGVVNDSLSLPRNHKYPVVFSIGPSDTSKILDEQDAEEPQLYLSDPVSVTYASTAHAVIALPSMNDTIGSRVNYKQTILPRMHGFNSEGVVITPSSPGSSDTGALLPWINNTAQAAYPYKDYYVSQGEFKLHDSGAITEGDQYVYIGEIYYDYQDADQIRYGGTSDAAIQNNRFLIAGPQYIISDMSGDGSDVMIANQGDTYIQRWDCLKTKPYSTGAVNNVIDITSVMLETHVNIDGRTDLQRGTSYIASIDAEKWGSLNPVYSQYNNFIVQRDLDTDFNLDTYRSSLTWTLEKHDSEDVDAWTHITLASTLKLDGDKGVCQALRRFNNSIIAFQDRAISEILFNSRTQLATTDGVPVEIANSGKVDGKRYISNKFGCVNKWSIVEGKSALYFVDNINKQFCSATVGQTGRFGVGPISDQLGFGTWFKRNNSMSSWTPVEFENIVAFYDRVHSDVYLVKKNDSENQPCLVYNEALGAFTSFFDYNSVPMMTNVDDKFVSFRDGHLWKQNEGLYCNFFNEQYDFWTQYRVTPDPYSDKIWTNIDYRADFYEVLDENGTSVIPEEYLINGDSFGELSDTYKERETLTDYKVWDEYQTTGFVPLTHEHFDRDDVRKKFRIWRLAIPRALKEGTNKYGMDRIRNPWINILFRKQEPDGKNLVQLHDFVVKYFE